MRLLKPESKIGFSRNPQKVGDMTVALTTATRSRLIPDLVSRYGKAVMVKPTTKPNGSIAAPTIQGGGMWASPEVPGTVRIADNSPPF
jgi:hypothetical protein